MMGYVAQYLAGLVGQPKGERHPTDLYLDKLFLEMDKNRYNFGLADVNAHLDEECEDYA